MQGYVVKTDEEGLKVWQKYMEFFRYMTIILNKLPRLEKRSMGTDFKRSMYSEIENIMYISKVSKHLRLDYINKADALVAIQREYLRIMYDEKMIDPKKFKIAMEKIAEIGRMMGGLIRIYGTYNKK